MAPLSLGDCLGPDLPRSAGRRIGQSAGRDHEKTAPPGGRTAFPGYGQPRSGGIQDADWRLGAIARADAALPHPVWCGSLEGMEDPACPYTSLCGPVWRGGSGIGHLYESMVAPAEGKTVLRCTSDCFA